VTPYLLIFLLGLSAPKLVPGTPGISLSFDERWQRLEATPRLRGTGGVSSAVVIGHRNDELYVLTSEHVTRKSSNFTLEFFDRATYPAIARKVLYGSIIEEFPNPDFTILKFPAGGMEFPEVRLARLQDRPKRFPVDALTIGCTNGNTPTCEMTTITAKRLARRLKDEDVAFFWETERIPIPGRSGGPIFDGAGRLIGICSATTGGKGFYTHLDEILVGLKTKSLGWLTGENLPEVRKNR